MLSASVGPAYILSIIEFQLLRALFVLCPYEVLNFNHDQLAYPLVASVPTVSGILMAITYLDSGGLCIKQLLDLTFNKLDMEIVLFPFLHKVIYHT